MRTFSGVHLFYVCYIIFAYAELRDPTLKICKREAAINLRTTPEPAGLKSVSGGMLKMYWQCSRIFCKFKCGVLDCFYKDC